LDGALNHFTALSEGDEVHAAGSSTTVAQLRRAAVEVSNAVYEAYHAIGGAIDRTLAGRLESERRTLFLVQVEALLAIIVGVGIALLIHRTVRDRDRRELERARREAEQLSAELERQRVLEMLAVTEAQFRAVFNRSSIGVAIVDRNGAVIRSNAALHEMLDPVDSHRIGAGHADFVRLLNGEIESFATELEASGTGTAQWLEATHSLVREGDGTPLFAIAMLKDITERKRIDDRLRYEATHDSLSGLPNRAYFFDRVRQALFSERTGRGQHAVLFVDLDEFKFVNDSLGHAIGDKVLVAAAERLRQATGARDLVARFGGDEFAVLLEGRETREEIERIVERIVRELGQPLFVEGREIFVTASVGVAMYVPTYAAVEEILRDADTAMYYAKTAGRSRSAIFDATMHDQASRRLEIATQLRRALERDQVYLTYQPVVSLATGRIEAFETLLRWEHPDLGLVSPGEFIPIAEEIGLIVPIGRWVVASSCEQLTRWRREGIMRRPLRLSVNASVREILQTDYCDFIEATVQRFGLEPGDLVLEVTESAVLASGKFSSNTLERIKSAGVGLAIDDFGTGYSSLRYLQQFPFDELKIDRSFVSGIDGKLASEAIVTMLLSLGKAFGVGVVAEGVETAAQASRLRALGCTAAQGYFYGVPLRAQAVEELLRREQSFAS
ncbi:MAG TPA: EAL domain-containing protein, partial [Candidatus Baltobacteraceae bacterium]|nr:EAL domain-containing protein [Candidatus Baltobacteraceae bacterium]